MLLMESVKPVAAVTPIKPNATPTTAVSSGRPAATREPNVMISTTAATVMPMSSLCIPRDSLSWKALPE